MAKSRRGKAMILGALLFAAARLQAQTNPDWTTPIAPFRIAGNLYYVGGKDLASYLIVTPKGEILINPSLESSIPMIRASVEQLGFKFEDIKIVLISHSPRRSRCRRRRAATRDRCEVHGDGRGCVRG
jgi:metallo-beta-lactamase class B